MKRLVLAASVSLVALVSAPAMAADVGVSVTVGQPGFYGHIDIGDFPQPQVIYRQPVLVRPVPMHVEQGPIYVRVPPGHRRNWSRYCGRYDACGRPVYFVNDRWYNNVYAPRYRERYERDHHDDRRGGDRGKWHGDDHPGGGDYGPGNGNGNRGRGHGHGHDD